MRIKVALLFFFLGSSLAIFGQNRFTRNPWELWTQAGISIYSGDIPSSVIRSEQELSDLELGTLNVVLGLGLNYRFARHFDTRHSLNFIQFSGHDKYNPIIADRERNLSFRNHLFEWSSMILWSPIHWDGLRRNKHHHLYVGSGLILFAHKPQAKYNGTYHNLRPLGTEGQGVIRGKEVYSIFETSLPLVAGYRYKINKQFVIGIEANLRKTFTDYLDDLSTNYADNAKIAEANGEVAAALADRNLSSEKKPSGFSRGNATRNDNYTFANFTFSYFIGSR